MLLLTVLLCLALQRFANVGNWFQISWFEAYLHRLNPWLIKLNEWVAMLIIVAPILIALAILHFLLKPQLYGLLDLIFTTLVLLLCIDSRDYRHILASYFTNMEKNDVAEASRCANDIIGDLPSDSSGALCRAVTTTILNKAFVNIFSGLFWFMLFGIYGAATYFIVKLTKQYAIKVDPNYGGVATMATFIHNLLDWPASRLLGISYALVGNFNKGFEYCSTHLWLALTETHKYSSAAGLAAMAVEPDVTKAHIRENYDALNLVDRSLVIWLVALALVLLGLWL